MQLFLSTTNIVVDSFDEEVTIIGQNQQMENNIGNYLNTLLVEEYDANSNNNHSTYTTISTSTHHDQNSFDHYYSNMNNNNNTNNIQFPCFPTQTTDLLNLLHFPTSPKNSSISFENHNNNIITCLPNPSSSSSNIIVGQESSNFSNVFNDPLLHLNLQAPPLLHQSSSSMRELFHHHGYYNMVPTTSRSDFVFGLGENNNNNNNNNDIIVELENGGYGRDVLENGVLEEFTNHHQEVANKKRGGKRSNNNNIKQFSSTNTERQRRVDLGGKFDALKELIPSSTKNDRASVVGDAIDYIKELLRTVNELKSLVEKKRYEKQRVKKKLKIEDEEEEEKEDDENNSSSYSESLTRSSWIQRKSKESEVDVRIIDNEVTIKIVQRKRVNDNNCILVYASKVLDELKLDLQHVGGGHIGDFCSFLFNSKICEGSSVYASAIANKLIEVMDRSLLTI
ncbi:hypothetical protein HN51_061041 [Arachis hypogaea]|uniref:BHLH domain-containing protein n=1 Tax=Arachis hypogaea TaxID=3818 RepID=A0A445ALV5_ARAHY|nr:transcription factor bHLH10-like [Arachis ipaensis]XP_025630948.1 transcription factor bHLH10 [Arachis hypogaea]RYR27421.1 hypothetical protein Ahy_B01g051456 [Arachis hypogaea]